MMRMRLAWRKSQKTLDTSKRFHQNKTQSTGSVDKGLDSNLLHAIIGNCRLSNGPTFYWNIIFQNKNIGYKYLQIVPENHRTYFFWGQMDYSRNVSLKVYFLSISFNIYIYITNSKFHKFPQQQNQKHDIKAKFEKYDKSQNEFNVHKNVHIHYKYRIVFIYDINQIILIHMKYTE